MSYILSAYCKHTGIDLNKRITHELHEVNEKVADDAADLPNVMVQNDDVINSADDMQIPDLSVGPLPPSPKINYFNLSQSTNNLMSLSTSTSALNIEFLSRPLRFNLSAGDNGLNVYIAHIYDDNMYTAIGLKCGLYIHTINGILVDNKRYFEIVRLLNRCYLPLNIGFNNYPPLNISSPKIQTLISLGYNIETIEYGWKQLNERDDTMTIQNPDFIAEMLLILTKYQDSIYNWMYLESVKHLYFNNDIQPLPIYYYSHTYDTEYMIFAPCYSKCVYKYDIKKDIFSVLFYYPNNFNPLIGFNHVIDYYNKIYYIFGGNNNVLGSIHLDNNNNNNNLSIHKYNNYNIINENNMRGYFINNLQMISLFINNGFNGEIHVDNTNKMNINIKHNHKLVRRNHSIQYINSINRMYIIGGIHPNQDINTILLYNTNTSEYEMCDFKLPRSLTNIEFGEYKDYQCCVLDHKCAIIVIIFAFKLQQLWCINLKNLNAGWIKHSFNFPYNNWNGMKVVPTKYYYIHFINLFPKSHLYHIKISLFDLLPKRMLKQYYIPLVNGFTHEIMKSVPNDIIRLIHSFSF